MIRPSHFFQAQAGKLQHANYFPLAVWQAIDQTRHIQIGNARWSSGPRHILVHIQVHKFVEIDAPQSPETVNASVVRDGKDPGKHWITEVIAVARLVYP